MSSATVARRRYARHDSLPAQVRVDHGVVAVFAREMGKTSSWARNCLYGYPRLNLTAAAAIRAYQQRNDQHGLHRFVAPIKAELAGGDVLPLTTELLVRAQAADSEEDVAETAFALCQTEEAAERYLRKLDRALVLMTAVRDAIVRRYGWA